MKVIKLNEKGNAVYVNLAANIDKKDYVDNNEDCYLTDEKIETGKLYTIDSEGNLKFNVDKTRLFKIYLNKKNAKKIKSKLLQYMLVSNILNLNEDRKYILKKYYDKLNHVKEDMPEIPDFLIGKI